MNDDKKKVTGSLHSSSLFRRIKKGLEANFSHEDISKLRPVIKKAIAAGIYQHNDAVGSVANVSLNVLLIMIEEMQLRNVSLLAALLYLPTSKNIIGIDQVRSTFGNEVAEVIKGLIKVDTLDAKQSAMASDNYINLLLSFAEDIRVVLINIAQRLYMMRNAMEYSPSLRSKLTIEVAYIYTPLAHKLGLYNIKTEFEDLHLKYTDSESYDFIVKKISESKESRDKYVGEFIAPINERLQNTGLKYELKGRVKSISSINNKLKKQKIDFESIYDLFAIRVVIRSPLKNEKSDCWQAYSIVTDLYTPNPKRLKDWLSIPKSNGYESLHITVMGQQARWVEVQIRSERMNEIAERGLAAHWKYKGVKSESKLDDWLSNLREMLVNKNLDADEKLDNFKLDLYDDEIYVFTPKGDLHKLPHGSTVLDFAFSIHSRIGSTCVSGKANGRNVSIRHKLSNGDQIEIVTSPNQSPKQDWLNVVTTTKAKNRIRQSLKEEANKQVDEAKEMMKRRLKNRKMEMSESVMMRQVKKMGYKTLTDFYIKIADGNIDINSFIDQYLELERKTTESHDKPVSISAQSYVPQIEDSKNDVLKSEELIIDKNITGVEYHLAKCCNPIYGDNIYGFVSTQGIKIHRSNCPNAPDMLSRFGYRVIPARWSGPSSAHYIVTLRMVGHDDIGIINNLTSIIGKENGVSMRSISIDSNDGLFHGNISVMLSDTDVLNGLLKKLRSVKGIKDVSRLS